MPRCINCKQAVLDFAAARVLLADRLAGLAQDQAAVTALYWEVDRLAAEYNGARKRGGIRDGEPHGFAVWAILYFVHDAEKDTCPEVLSRKLWREGVKA